MCMSVCARVYHHFDSTQSTYTQICQYTNNMGSEIDKITANKECQSVIHATPKTFLILCCLFF